jgi:hypothetical protein
MLDASACASGSSPSRVHTPESVLYPSRSELDTVESPTDSCGLSSDDALDDRGADVVE